jgi:hypothetical protein
VQVALQHRQQIDTIVQTLSYVAQHLPRIKSVADLFVVSQRIETAVCGLYRDLIQFFLEATYFLSRNPGNNLARFILPWRRRKNRHLKGEFSALFASIQEHTDWIDTEANYALHLFTQQIFSRNHNEILSAISKLGSPPAMSTSATTFYRIIPHVKNPNFFGRADELDLLESILVSDKHVRLSMVSVLGEGGVGKSQLALHFAYHHLSNFRAIFWIPSETEVKLAQGFENIAVEIGLIQSSGNQASLHDSREAVKKWFRTTSKNLAGLDMH